MAELEMWTIYDHPSDYPDCFVARRWAITGEYTTAADVAMCATTDVLTSQKLDELRRGFERKGLVRMHRMLEDDPTIVEVWL